MTETTSVKTMIRLHLGDPLAHIRERGVVRSLSLTASHCGYIGNALMLLVRAQSPQAVMGCT